MDVHTEDKALLSVELFQQTVINWAYSRLGIASDQFRAMRDGHFPTMWNSTAPRFMGTDPRGHSSIITIPGYFEVEFLAGDPSEWRWDPMSQCSVFVGRKPKVHFPPCEVDGYELHGSKIGTIPYEEGVLFQKSKWGQAFDDVNVPADLISLLDERLADFRTKSQFYTRDPLHTEDLHAPSPTMYRTQMR